MKKDKTMNIVQALQNKDNHLRISNGTRWLCGDGSGGWVVYERKPYAKNTKILIECSGNGSEEFAVKILLGERDSEDE